MRTILGEKVEVQIATLLEGEGMAKTCKQSTRWTLSGKQNGT